MRSIHLYVFITAQDREGGKKGGKGREEKGRDEGER
jgi:hypothetical protein